MRPVAAPGVSPEMMPSASSPSDAIRNYATDAMLSHRLAYQVDIRWIVVGQHHFKHPFLKSHGLLKSSWCRKLRPARGAASK
jgi:hypothetical protein